MVNTSCLCTLTEGLHTRKFAIVSQQYLPLAAVQYTRHFMKCFELFSTFFFILFKLNMFIYLLLFPFVLNASYVPENLRFHNFFTKVNLPVGILSVLSGLTKTRIATQMYFP